MLTLLRENNQMLKELLSYVRKFDSNEYQAEQDAKAFSINVCANIVVEALDKNGSLCNSVTEKFGLNK